MLRCVGGILLRLWGNVPSPVILTKVRTQGTEHRLSWLWVLTFVRMTGWMGTALASIEF
jgi:hypothetical protein